MFPCIASHCLVYMSKIKSELILNFYIQELFRCLNFQGSQSFSCFSLTAYRDTKFHDKKGNFTYCSCFGDISTVLVFSPSKTRWKWKRKEKIETTRVKHAFRGLKDAVTLRSQIMHLSKKTTKPIWFPKGSNTILISVHKRNDHACARKKTSQ